jgi:post-segregation antitoxin (ccd killing protein)
MPTKTAKVPKVSLAVKVPLDLMEQLDDLQRRLRRDTLWTARSESNMSALLTQAIQEFIHAHG